MGVKNAKYVIILILKRHSQLDHDVVSINLF